MRANNFIDMKNKHFGLLKVLQEAGKIGKRKKQMYWLCQCSCGTQKIIAGNNLRSGQIKSCGCQIGKTITHGNCANPLFDLYRSIKARCYNSNNKAYHNYGGRGIKMSKSWYNSFEQFCKDMGSKPHKDFSIERINNNKGYSKQNCKWATTKEQGNNKRTCIYLTYKGKTLNITQWAELSSCNRSVLYSRYHKGQNIEQILKEVSLVASTSLPSKNI